MKTRTVNTATLSLRYDAENRIVSTSGAAVTSFAYDGDGRRVKSTANGVTTIFIGKYYEEDLSPAARRSYYYAGSQRIGLRTGGGSGVTGLLWLVGDHLGSGTVSMDAATGVKTYERYKPWGDTRGSTTLPTRYQFTGQRREASLNGLYDYGARWYDSLAGVFLQPDSLVPDPYNPLDWNGFLFVRGNPTNYTDPSGHIAILATALIGASIAAVVDYSFQVANNLNNGQSVQQSMVNVDLGEVAGAAVAGGFAGLTLGAGTALLASVGGTIATTSMVAVPVAAVSGGVGNAVGGQLGALTEAGVHQIGKGGFDQTEFFGDAYESGLFNYDDFMWDAGSGAILSAGGQAVTNIFSPSTSSAGKYAFYKERIDLEGNRLPIPNNTPAKLPGDPAKSYISPSVAGIMNKVSGWTQEIFSQWADRERK